MAVLATGCKSKPMAAVAPPPKKDSMFTDTTVMAGNGTLDMYTRTLPRLKAFTLHWETASASAKSADQYSIKAQQVSGQIFRSGKAVAKYSADSGSADKGSGILVLEGNVRITSLDDSSKTEGSTLSCQTVTYSSSDEIIKARGGVTVKGQQVEMGPFDSIWSSNDFSEVAAPDVFVPVRHNHASAPNK